ncbi:MAG: hypothetical protein IKB10_02910 [Alphaproteobacteria bacterium]|nr:hypothetical protein [Alphaproteobacteria bacterium]
MLIHQSARCENTNQKWVGKWYLNDLDTVFGGVMDVFNCDDTTCDFKLESWYDLHICDVDGKIKINGDKAEYNDKKYQYDRETDTEYFIPVGILFQMESEDKMNLRFINADSFSAFCGMQATLEGIWIRQ